MVTKNSRIGKIVRREQVTIRFMSSGRCVLSSPRKLLGEEPVLINSPFQERRGLGQEAFGPLRLSIDC